MIRFIRGIRVRSSIPIDEWQYAFLEQKHERLADYRRGCQPTLVGADQRICRGKRNPDGVKECSVAPSGLFVSC